MYYVLLSGGFGRRLWPLSNEARPKQFIRAVKKEKNTMENCSMIQRVWEQLEEAGMASHTIVSAAQEQTELIESQLGRMEIAREPEQRGTFAAVLLSCAYLHDKMGADLEDYVAIMPVDPYTEGSYFTSLQGLEQIMQDSQAEVGLMGVKPLYPAVRYGYILPGEQRDSYFLVRGFVEKPEEKEARELVAEGALWNCGVFCVKIADMLERTKTYGADGSYESVLKNYGNIPKISFDYQVVEKARDLAAIEFRGFWRDLGTWDAFGEQMSTDTIGRVLLDEGAENTQVINELEIPVVVLGTRDLVVAASQDGILVTEKSQAFRVGEATTGLKSRPMFEERRWGTLETLDDTGEEKMSTLTRKIRIYDGMNSSYHFHRERDEIWTVLEGTGELLLEGNRISLFPGKAVCIRRNQRHAVKALQNFSYIEIHVGTSTGNEDINRITFQWDEIERSSIL
ncbi:MAG: cupin domain-containing protein [Lachnospiraceae bacterium]|nr:cupin domain-containing protein [Lachnospiraceae bacterium]